MKIKYKSDYYNALNYYIHELKHNSSWFEIHTEYKEILSTRTTI